MEGYKIHNCEYVREHIDSVIAESQLHTYKQAAGIGRRVGGSLKRNNLSEYKYINTRRVLTLRELYKKTIRLCEELNVADAVLLMYYLKLLPNDFLDIQDTWVDKTLMNRGFSIALTNSHIQIEDELVHVPKYSAIEFSPCTIHSIPKVDNEQSWLVLSIANYKKL